MDYKLAKRLKDAGFPQKCENYALDDACEEPFIESEHNTHKCAVAIPTLEELIDACVDIAVKDNADMFRLRHEPANLDGSWDAFAAGCGANGDTKIDAVANLWLKLNETNI